MLLEAREQVAKSTVSFCKIAWEGSWWAVSFLIRVISWLISLRTLNARLHCATGTNNNSPHGTTRYHLFSRIKLNLTSVPMGKDLFSERVSWKTIAQRGEVCHQPQQEKRTCRLSRGIPLPP